MTRKTALEENILAVPLVPQVDFDSILSVPVFEPPRHEEVPFLLDNGLNYRAFPVGWELYTAVGVHNENPRNRYWVGLEEGGHILPTHTHSDFVSSSGIVQVTGMGIYAGISTNVFYNTNGTSVTCPKGNSTTVTLTSNQGTAPVCSHVSASTADLGLLELLVALPFTLVTQDTCLGWCARYLSSYTQEPKTGKLIRWGHKFGD